MSKETYKRILVMAGKVAFGVSVDWDTGMCEVTPKGASRGGTFRVNIHDTTPADAERLFGLFYNIDPKRLTEVSDPSEFTLTRRPKVKARRLAGRPALISEKPHGRKETRKNEESR